MDKKLFKRGNFLWREFTFAGYASVGEFWSELALRIIGYFCAVIFLSIFLSVVMPSNVEEILAVLDILLPILGFIWVIPILALSRRRLRDAGYSAKSYLWLLVPAVGLIVFLVRLCSKTVPREPEQIWFEYE